MRVTISIHAFTPTPPTRPEVTGVSTTIHSSSERLAGLRNITTAAMRYGSR